MTPRRIAIALPEASPYARHLPQLDGIRGLAVLAVIVFHVFPGNTDTPLTMAFRKLVTFGATGVDLFFVLSGFLITGILYDSLRDDHFFRKFYARRVLRVFPLYYAVLAVYAVVGLVHGYWWHGRLLSLALYLQNTQLIGSRWSADLIPLPLGHFWSLAIEEQFYLFWPLIVFLVRDRKKLLWICAASFLMMPLARLWFWTHGWSYYAVHESTYCRADCLLAGAALALLLRGRMHDRTLRIAPWLLFGVLVGAALNPAFPKEGGVYRAFWPTFQFAFRYTALAAGYVGLVAWSLSSDTGNRLFRVRPLRELGKYSYGLYVLHVILLSYLGVPLRDAIAAHITPNKGVGVVLTGLVILGLSGVAAYLSYQLYEKQFLRLKRFFDYRPHGHTAAGCRAADVSHP